MRGLVLVDVGHIEVRDDLPAPAITTPTDAVVRVERAGLCGSDLHPYRGHEPFLPGVVAGHEAVGVVTDVGSAVTNVAPGDRVLVPFTTSCGECAPCRRGLSARCSRSRLFGWGAPDGSSLLHGMQAEAVLVPDADGTLVPLPDGIDDATGVLLADNLPTAWYAALRTGARADEPVAVLGAGPVGLCTIVSLHAHGVRPVICSDPVEGRRSRAARLGARGCSPEQVAEVVQDLTGGEGVAAVVDAAGTAASFAAAVDLVRPGGTVQVVAVPTQPTMPVAPPTAYDRNLTIRFGRAPVRSLLPDVLDAIRDGRLRAPTEQALTGPPLPLTAGPEAYRRAAGEDRDAEPPGKLTFDPRLG